MGVKQLIIRLASFVWDIPIQKVSTPQNEYLELVWSRGKKMLNTKNANFSFGNAYKVFEVASKPISGEISKAKNILVLGFGCGSLLHLLENTYGYLGELTGVEYDASIVSMFNEHFAEGYQLKPRLVIEDALIYVKEAQVVYEVIYVDLFEDLNNSPLIGDTEFWMWTKERLSTEGVLVINTTRQSDADKDMLSQLLIVLSGMFKIVETEVFQNLNYIVTAK